MTKLLDNALADRLDAIEARGRRHLDDSARRATRIVAVTWATRATPIAAGATLATALLTQAGPIALASIAAASPLSILAAVHWRARWRSDVERSVALALFDHRLGLKDRIVTSDEFSRDRNRDGFREASLDEARPWIDNALSMPLDGEAGRGGLTTTLRRDWLFVAAAGGLLLLAALVHQARTAPLRKDGAIGTAQTALAAVGVQAAGAGLRQPAHPEGPGGPSPTVAEPRKVGGSADRAEENASPIADDLRAAAVASPGPAARPAASAGTATGRSSTPSSSDASPPNGGSGRRERSGDRAQAAGQRAPAATPIVAKADAATTAPASPATDSKGAPKREGSSGSPPTGAPPAPRTPQQAANTARPNSPKRPQSGQQSAQSGAQSGSQKNGQGSGRAAGQDALKKARGISALLLAVPMDDRLTGTVNAGRVSTTDRQTTPRASPAASVSAQARGDQHGDAGRIVHRSATLHDDRLLNAFFRRAGGDAAGVR